jgi:hypothetical protein
LGKLLTKQQKESKLLLLQAATKQNKDTCRYVSLHYDTIHHDDHRTDNGKALVQAKSKRSKNNFYRREEACGGGVLVLVLVLVPFTSFDKWGALQTHDERKEYQGGVS